MTRAAHLRFPLASNLQRVTRTMSYSADLDTPPCCGNTRWFIHRRHHRNLLYDIILNQFNSVRVSYFSYNHLKFSSHPCPLPHMVSFLEMHYVFLNVQPLNEVNNKAGYYKMNILWIAQIIRRLYVVCCSRVWISLRTYQYWSKKRQLWCKHPRSLVGLALGFNITRSITVRDDRVNSKMRKYRAYPPVYLFCN
jgi:hypothetical protein